MKIKLGESGYVLTTSHPACCRFRLGVLEGKCGEAYTPGEALPLSPKAIQVFGEDTPPLLAGELVVMEAKAHIWGLDEIAYMRRYLAQDPCGQFTLPDEKTLYGIQSVAQFAIELGDISQGASEIYYRECKARVSEAVTRAARGKYRCDNSSDYMHIWVY